MKRSKEWILAHRYYFLLLLFIPYTLGYYLTGHLLEPVAYIHCRLDDLIPYMEIFIVPYVLWYVYVGGVMFWLMVKDKTEFQKYCVFLFTGLFICIFIFILWPTGVDFRPEPSGTGLFGKLVQIIFTIDNPTNVCPSIHVYASLVALVTVIKSSVIKKNFILTLGAWILTISICLSTVFLKQHSVIDGLCGGLLCLAVYLIVYRIPWTAFAKKKEASTT